MTWCKEAWIAGNLIRFCEKIKFEDISSKNGESYSFLENYFKNSKYTEINHRDLTATTNLLACILFSIIIYIFIKDWIEAKIDRFIEKVRQRYQ